MYPPVEKNRSFTIDPIGILHTSAREKYEVPHQPNTDGGIARITLFPHMNYEQALIGLEEFSHVWVLFLFHKSRHWKPMVQPPGLRTKVGVFATRSPHRPNNIGMSALPLISVEKRGVLVAGADLLDGTPVIDIKPYVATADSFSSPLQGWIEARDSLPQRSIQYSKEAEEVREVLLKKGVSLPLETILHRRTMRIDGKWEKGFILAYKQLRLAIEEAEQSYIVHSILHADSM